MAEVTAVNTDEDFMEEMTKIKKLLNIEAIDELKPKQTELLRGKIMGVLKYVMDQLKAEEASEEQPTEEAEEEAEEEGEETASEQSPAVVAPAVAPVVAPVVAPLPGSSMSLGGRTKQRQKGRKQKGGWGAPIDMGRVTNTTEGGLNGTKDPYSAISGTADVDISTNLHKAFTAGNTKGFSSVGGLPASELNTMLPAYGTAQVGGAKKKRNNKKK